MPISISGYSRSLTQIELTVSSDMVEGSRRGDVSTVLTNDNTKLNYIGPPLAPMSHVIFLHTLMMHDDPPRDLNRSSAGDEVRRSGLQKEERLCSFVKSVLHIDALLVATSPLGMALPSSLA